MVHPFATVETDHAYQLPFEASLKKTVRNLGKSQKGPLQNSKGTVLAEIGHSIFQSRPSRTFRAKPSDQEFTVQEVVASSRDTPLKPFTSSHVSQMFLCWQRLDSSIRTGTANTR
jgi:hypothetical protein